MPRSPLQPGGKGFRSVLHYFGLPDFEFLCAGNPAHLLRVRPEAGSCNLVYVDPDLTLADVKKHLKEFGYSGVPAILDSTQKLVNATGASVTPEAAVIGASGKVLYRGRIDNVYAWLGKRRPEATEKDLRKAIDEVLSGKPVSTPETKAIGCYIPPVGVK